MIYMRIGYFLLFLLFFPSYVFAQKLVVIKTFNVNGPQEYKYLADALPSIIESRISSPGIKAQQEETEESHYTITGTANVLGNHISIDIRLETNTGEVAIYPVTATKDTILPEIEQMIPALQSKINAEQLQILDEEKEEKSEASFLSSVDWQNAIALPIAPRGLRIIDLDNDGEKEYLILGEKELLIYQRDGTIFTEKSRYTFKGREVAKYIAVAPLYEEKVAIFVTVMLGVRSPYSYIFTYENGALEVKESGLPYLFGAYYNAEEKKVIPLLQEVALYPSLYFSHPVHKVTIHNNKIQKGEKIPLPHQANIFNFTTFMMNDNVHIAVITPELESLALYKTSPFSLFYKTEQSYASTTYFLNTIPKNRTQGKNPKIQEPYYVPMHFIQLGEEEQPIFLLASAVNRSIVTTTYRAFSKYVVEAVRLNADFPQTVWTSAPISATLADIDINLNEKGETELFVLVTYTPIVASFQKQRSSLLFQAIRKNKVVEKGTSTILESSR